MYRHVKQHVMSLTLENKNCIKKITEKTNYSTAKKKVIHIYFQI